jgi:NAD(P)-dependent dehydrogenase (short-subunit alcohol dehydrogenase family)
MIMTLAGKVALVTGGSRSLGRAIAQALATEGAHIAITYIASAGKAEAVVREIEAKAVRGFAIQSDQGDPTAAEPLIRGVVDHFGKLDILVNNAAISLQGKTLDDPEIDNTAMDRQWATNVAGIVANIRAASRYLPDGGRIISIGSLLGSRAGFPGTADYVATKAAIVGYSKGAARDLGRRNITVNVIQAGVMATDMVANPEGKLPPGYLDLFAIRRLATVEEVAAGVVYLSGPNAGFITRSVLDISGGYLA